MNDFIFLANWYDVIKAYEDAGQEDMASAIAKEIIIYGVTGDTETTDPLIYGIVRGMCTAQMNRPKSRNIQSIANGKKGGRPPEYSPEVIRQMYKDGATIQEIADALGCNKRTVQRALNSVDTTDDEI